LPRSGFGMSTSDHFIRPAATRACKDTLIAELQAKIAALPDLWSRLTKHNILVREKSDAVRA
jgi:hypothetical protein